MTTRKAILSVLGVIFFAIVGGLTVGFLTIDPNDGNAADRFSLLGEATGQLCLIPLVVIAFLWVRTLSSKHDT